jgi:hypothetical protein
MSESRSEFNFGHATLANIESGIAVLRAVASLRLLQFAQQAALSSIAGEK